MEISDTKILDWRKWTKWKKNAWSETPKKKKNRSREQNSNATISYPKKQETGFQIQQRLLKHHQFDWGRKLEVIEKKSLGFGIPKEGNMKKINEETILRWGKWVQWGKVPQHLAETSGIETVEKKALWRWKSKKCKS